MTRTQAPWFDAPWFDGLKQRTVYVRPDGSDSSGTGALTAPYATLVRATHDLPDRTPCGIDFTINCTGIDETLPDDFVLGGWRGDNLNTFGVGLGQRVAINIVSDLQLAAALSAPNQTITALQIESTTFDARRDMMILDTNKTFTPGELKGLFLIDSSGARGCMIHDNDADKVYTTAPSFFAGDFEPPYSIMEPGAIIRGTSATPSFRGALTCAGFDVVNFEGIKFVNTSPGSPSVVTWGGQPVFSYCDIAFPVINNPIRQALFGKCVLRDWDFFANFYVAECLLLQDLGEVTEWGNPGTQGFSFFSVFDGCNPLQLVDSATTSTLQAGNWKLKNSLMRNGTGAAVIFSGGNFYAENCDFDDNTDDAFLAQDGGGYAQLVNCGGTGNGGIGINNKHGAHIKIDADTDVTGTGGDMKCGSLAVRSYASFRGAGATQYNEFDNASGDTGVTGGRIFQDP